MCMWVTLRDFIQHTSHLVAALRRYQIDTYFNEDTLPRGDEVSQALKEAIQSSKISLIIFSED